MKRIKCSLVNSRGEPTDDVDDAWYLRMYVSKHEMIDVDLFMRHDGDEGAVRIRGTRSVIIEPEVSNAFIVRIKP